jgi:hypothetical protein
MREIAAERKAWPQRIRIAGCAAKAQSDGGGCGGPVLKMQKPPDVVYRGNPFPSLLCTQM